MDIQIKIILFVILILLILNYNKTENMSNTDIKKMITDIYKLDVDAIRNLSKMANDLTLNNSLKVPGGLNVSGDINIDKGLNVTGPLNFLPKGTIVAFNGTTAPAGWAICDGQTVNGYKTPDLRGRFIRMHTDGKVTGNYKDFSMNVKEYGESKGYSRTNTKTYIAKQNFNEHGGSDFVNLDVKEIPSHSHSVNINTNSTGSHSHRTTRTLIGKSGTTGGWNQGGSSCVKPGWNGTWKNNSNPVTDRSCSYPTISNNGDHSHNVIGNTANTGSSESHNNTPPYYVLTWIVKVV